jgi:hypothetical protein
MGRDRLHLLDLRPVRLGDISAPPSRSVAEQRW